VTDIENRYLIKLQDKDETISRWKTYYASIMESCNVLLLENAKLSQLKMSMQDYRNCNNASYHQIDGYSCPLCKECHVCPHWEEKKRKVY